MAVLPNKLHTSKVKKALADYRKIAHIDFLEEPKRKEIEEIFFKLGWDYNGRGTCMAPNCHYDESRRGLCRYCYGVAHRLVYRGRVTWAQLIKWGYAKEKCGQLTRPIKKLVV